MRAVREMPMAATQKQAVQPFTFGGVARFASGTIVRLIVAALLFAALAAAAAGHIYSSCWAPVIDEAVNALPPASKIEGARLLWPEPLGKLLGANSFLSFEVSLNESGIPQIPIAPADIAVQFGGASFLVRSLFGFTTFPYLDGYTIQFNRTALGPIWGAWRAPLTLAGMAVTAALLIFTWAALALIYAPAPLLLGSAMGRDISFARAWKLAVAAQLPGSLVMAFSLVLYSTGHVSVLFLAVMLGVHFIPTTFYLLVSPVFLPRLASIDSRQKQNPFKNENRKTGKSKNPFNSES
jgi:hypothetical protein